MKKITALLTSVLLVLGLLPVFAFAAPAASGECGAADGSVVWTLDKNGALTVAGHGAMRDYDWGASPWYGNDAIKTVRIGSGVTAVGDYAFYGCASLRQVSLPDGLVSVGDYAFCGCAKLADAALPGSLREIGSGAFYGCAALTEAAIPAGVETISSYAFYNCAALADLALPASLKGIDGSAFSGCAGLSSILVPDTVTDIADDAFPAQAMLYGGADSALRQWAEDHGRAFTVKGGTKLTLTAPAFVSETSVCVCGFAAPGAEVTCFVNDEKTATVTAAAGGRWSARLPFTGVKEGGSVTVKASVSEGDQTVTRVASVVYRPAAAAFRELTLEHNFYTVHVTEEDRNAPKRNVTLSPDRPFSVRVSVTNSDRVERLCLYSTRSGVAKTIELTYDRNSDSWLGSGWFDNNDHAYVPGTLTVEGKDKNGADLDAGISLKLNFLREPAGYVYEAVRSNKVADAAAAVYYRDADGRDLLWNAAESEQFNPAPTLPDGSFTWAVPRGTWQIRVTKEGYRNTATDWMTVPPGSDQVFLPLVTKQAPEIAQLFVYEDRAEITFTQYMEIGSVNAETLQAEGFAGTIEPIDAEETTPGSGVFYAKAFRFTPDVPFEGTVRFTVNGVKNYAGIAMAQAYETALPVAEEPSVFTATDAVSLPCNGAAEIAVSAADAAGATVTATAEDGIIALSDETLTLDAEGKATLTVTGLMPGAARIRFTLDGTALSAQTTVTVLPRTEQAALPGDADGDGAVTPADARQALRIAVKLEPCEADSPVFKAADANRDGAVTPEDARLILRAAVGLEQL